MEKIETANSPKHNFRKRWDRYIKTKSTRSLEAIYRTKRFDAGFFWMEFYPLAKDLFISQHKYLNESDLEILLQLHANQPFTKDDIANCVLSRKKFKETKFDYKTSLGLRAMNSFIKHCLANKVLYVHKKNGRYNKTQYYLSRDMESDIRKIYSHMLCLSKIRLNDKSVVNEDIKKSTSHHKKILKQNLFCDKFKDDIETQISTTNSEFGIKLRDARMNCD